MKYLKILFVVKVSSIETTYSMDNYRSQLLFKNSKIIYIGFLTHLLLSTFIRTSQRESVLTNVVLSMLDVSAEDMMLY